MPKLGVSSKPFSSLRQLSSSHVRVIELNTGMSQLLFSDIKKVKPLLKGFDISVHSKVTMLFEDDDAGLETLRSEVRLCTKLGAKELVFHTKHEKLNKDEADKMRDIIEFARLKGVDMLYESNGIIIADVALDFLSRIPCGYVLDMGHLNNGVGRGMLGMKLDDFLNRIRGRVVYIHANSNNGRKDQHIALRDGTLDWKHVLSELDMGSIRRIISETRTHEDDIKNLEDIRDYLGL